MEICSGTLYSPTPHSKTFYTYSTVHTYFYTHTNKVSYFYAFIHINNVSYFYAFTHTSKVSYFYAFTYINGHTNSNPDARTWIITGNCCVELLCGY